MKTEEIIALKSMIEGISADNAHLYLWSTNNHLIDAFKVMQEWGFRYVTMITWIKDRQGLGQYFRGLSRKAATGFNRFPCPKGETFAEAGGNATND